MKLHHKIPVFRSIRHRILFFSILVTLVPSIGMGWFWFDLTRKATTEKNKQQLIDSAGIVEREIMLWFKERNYDLRVFANSFVILDNLSRHQLPSSAEMRKAEDSRTAPLQKIVTYLSLIPKQFQDYRRLMVLSPSGRIIAASDADSGDLVVAVPDDWEKQVAGSGFFAGDVYSIDEDASPLIMIGAPLLGKQNSVQLGFFIIELRLSGLLPQLKTSLNRATPEGVSGSTMLLLEDGRIFLAANQSDMQRKFVSPGELRLIAGPETLQEIVNDRGERLIGLAKVFSSLPWRLVITRYYDEVFASLFRARDQIITITGFLTLLIGATAALIARQIIFPLKALNNGVLRVAEGDLDVSVEVRRNDELGLVTRMFNDMVNRLREDQRKLEQLATTDALTGLANRKQIMADLTAQMERYRRYGTVFSLLMLDIDHFKNINDSHGHLTGDAVLVTLAQILQASLRSLDSAGRYGGEEFLVILCNTDSVQAVQIAERIRLSVDQHIFTCGEALLHATISIGVAGVAPEDMTEVGLIERADKALYDAKTSGRNRVMGREVDLARTAEIQETGAQSLD